MKYSDKLIIILTKECNRKCRFCIDRPNRQFYAPEKKYMDQATLERVLDFATEHQIKTIALNGGEPTLHPDVVNIAKTIKARGFFLKIFTNYDHPEVIKALDGIVDVVRVSYYGPMNLPKQKDFKSQITLKIMLSQETFPKLSQLESFINEHRADFSNIKIHTLMQNNDFSIQHQVDYLSDLAAQYPLQRNDKGDYYHNFMGLKIEREDLPNLDYDINQRIYKAHLDGTISHYFEADHYQIGHMDQQADLTKVLRAHRNEKYRTNVIQAYRRGQLDTQNVNQYLEI